VADARCDALILTAAGITALRLPELTLADAAAQAARISDADESTVRDILAWPWQTTTGPVLRHPVLRRLLDPADPPRLWWVPTGPLALLPVRLAHRGHSPARQSLLPFTSERLGSIRPPRTLTRWLDRSSPTLPRSFPISTSSAG
jgi:hypothetical protein